MKFKPILKKAINGGMAVSMLCMTFTPLSKMQLEPFDVYAAVREIHQFQQVKQYNNNFADVGTSDWFYNSVAEAYKYDLVNGKSATKFDPKGNVTIAEVITMADKLHSYSTSGSLSPSIQMEFKWKQSHGTPYLFVMQKQSRLSLQVNFLVNMTDQPQEKNLLISSPMPFQTMDTSR